MSPEMLPLQKLGVEAGSVCSITGHGQWIDVLISLRIVCPVGSGRGRGLGMNKRYVSRDISRCSVFLL
jgi:hypothetical protein